MQKSHFWMVLLILISTVVSCTKDIDDELSLLGNWHETDPVPGRTELLFSTGNKLTIVDGDGSTEQYTYKILEETIILKLANDLEGQSELRFSQIDQNTLKIESFYPKIPEAPLQFIIFERE